MNIRNFTFFLAFILLGTITPLHADYGYHFAGRGSTALVATVVEFDVVVHAWPSVADCGIGCHVLGRGSLTSPDATEYAEFGIGCSFGGCSETNLVWASHDKPGGQFFDENIPLGTTVHVKAEKQTNRIRITWSWIKPNGQPDSRIKNVDTQDWEGVSAGYSPVYVEVHSYTHPALTVHPQEEHPPVDIEISNITPITGVMVNDDPPYEAIGTVSNFSVVYP